jgi:hypothetical protein
MNNVFGTTDCGLRSYIYIKHKITNFQLQCRPLFLDKK